MAFIVTTKEKMVEMIDYYIDCLRSEGAQMLILPAMDCDTPVDVEDCLAETVQYTALATRSFGAHGGLKVGELKVFSERTVADAIREMEGGSTKSFDLVIKAMKAALPVKTDADLQAVCTAIEAGTAFVLDFGGKRQIDKAKFAAATGLPTEGKTSREFSVFLHTVKKRHFIVAVLKGNEGPAASSEDILSQHFASVRERSAFDIHYGFTLPELKTGWDLLAQPKFVDLLAQLRSGYGYVIGANDEGMHIPY